MGKYSVSRLSVRITVHANKPMHQEKCVIGSECLIMYKCIYHVCKAAFGPRPQQKWIEEIKKQLRCVFNRPSCGKFKK